MAQLTITQILDLEHVITEDDEFTSREQVVAAINSVVWPAGTVMGKITSSGLYTPINPAASDGSQTFAGVLMFTLPISTTTTRTGAHVRKCSFNGNKLTYIIAPSGPQKAAIEADAASRVFAIVRY